MPVTSLGLGALYVYWRNGQVNFKTGWICALGVFFGGYFGAHIALRMPSRELEILFGIFLIATAIFLWATAWKRPGILEIEEDV